MARGSRGQKGQAAKSSGRGASGKCTKADDDEPPAKLRREESANTQLRKAITKAKASGSQENKTKKIKVDDWLTFDFPQADVYEDYACMLNQTNIGNNNNKFYIIQVAKQKKAFITFTRWGRVGESGQNNSDVFNNADLAIKSFKKKFKDKTKNDWDKRENFTPHTGKYTMIEIDDDDDEMEEEDTVDALGLRDTLDSLERDCSLPKRTQLMIALIFSEDMFEDQMSTMKLDVKKMPLGKLSKLQITKGLEALIDIEEAIKNKEPKNVLMDLSSKFYTLVPHDFGRTKPPVIDCDDTVREKKEVMLTLSDIELTLSLQKNKGKANKGTHPLLEKYEMLECHLEHVDNKSSEFQLLQKYANACPDDYAGSLLDIWRIDRKGEKERFTAHDDLKNRKLLWHGTNVAVVAAILKAGLRIMPHSGGCVGRGIYFASEHSKSSGYVGTHYGKFEGEEDVGFMFLAEVALGKEHSIIEVDCSLTKAPKGFDSIVARGQTEPDPKKDTSTDLEGKKVTVPVGKPIPQRQWSKSDFMQSEYLVYKESQVRLRYLLKFSFAETDVDN